MYILSWLGFGSCEWSLDVGKYYKWEKKLTGKSESFLIYTVRCKFYESQLTIYTLEEWKAEYIIVSIRFSFYQLLNGIE